MTWLDIITNALIEADWLAQGEVAQAQDANYCLGKINDLLDTWAADQRYVYAKQFNLFTLTPGLSPHTIGPSNATFILNPRPVKVDGCTIVINNGDQTATDIPVQIRDADWWNYVRIKNLQSQIPTDLYYEPDVPNGSLFFWPVPNFNYQVRLETWTAVGQVTNPNAQVVLPPAYAKAIRLTVAQELGGPRSSDPMLAKSAADARAVIWQNNNQSPTISTFAAGMPGGSGRSIPDFSFLDGTPW